jgi:hypothetical protein
MITTTNGKARVHPASPIYRGPSPAARLYPLAETITEPCGSTSSIPIWVAAGFFASALNGSRTGKRRLYRYDKAAALADLGAVDRAVRFAWTMPHIGRNTPVATLVSLHLPSAT